MNTANNGIGDFLWGVFIMERNSQTEIEFAKLYYDEFKYRHDMYWRHFFQFSTFISVLLAFPYLNADKFNNIGIYKVTFPILAIILTLVGAWNLAGEYERIRSTRDKLDELKGKYFIAQKIKFEGIKLILKPHIGTVITLVYLFGFLSLSIFCLIIMICQSI